MASVAGEIIAFSRVSANETDFALLDNEEVRRISVAPTAIPAADLSLSLSATTPDQFDIARLTVTILNSSQEISTNVEARIDIPAGVTILGISPVQGSFDAVTGIWTLGNLGDNFSRNLELTLDGSEIASAAPIVAEIIDVDEPDLDSAPDNGVATEDDFASLRIWNFIPPSEATPGNESLAGTDGADSIAGLAGDDTLAGGAGADTLSGGDGNDLFFVSDAADVVIETVGGGADTIITSVSNTIAPHVETLRIADGISGITITGGAGNDVLVGNGLANTFNGGAGDDVILAGNVTLADIYALFTM
jgi:Ca2+-binding RTX toxin-like protein